MKRTLTATVAAPAYAQVLGIDTTTTAATDADIDIAPSSIETGAEILVEGQPRPSDTLCVEAQGDADMHEPETVLETETNLDGSVPVRPTENIDLKS